MFDLSNINTEPTPNLASGPGTSGPLPPTNAVLTFASKNVLTFDSGYLQTFDEIP